MRARRVVLAYGVRDTLPDIPDVASYYGGSVFHCPDCDGYEVRDKRVGVIGWGKKSVGLALKLLQWTDQLTVLTDGHAREWTDEHHSKLLALGIGVKDEKVISLIGDNAMVRAAVLSTGERVAVDALFFTIGVTRSCLLAEDLGCEVDRRKAEHHRRRSQADVDRRDLRDRRPRPRLTTRDHLGRGWRDRGDRDQ